MQWQKRFQNIGGVWVWPLTVGLILGIYGPSLPQLRSSLSPSSWWTSSVLIFVIGSASAIILILLPIYIGGRKLDKVLKMRRELVTRYECCEWINLDQYAESKEHATKVRVERKCQVLREMTAFISKYKVSRPAVLKDHTLGAYVLLATAIKNEPRRGDDKIVLQMEPKRLSIGGAEIAILQAIEVLAYREDIVPSKHRLQLYEWADRMKPFSPVQEGLAKLRVERP